MPTLIKNKHKIKNVICELHGNPAYKNIYKDYEERYNNLIDELNNFTLKNDFVFLNANFKISTNVK